MKKYDIYVGALPNTEDERLLGAEIRPPLSDVVFEGLRSVLMHQPIDKKGPEAATFVALTRNDKDGTAFVAEYAHRSPIYLAERIAALINPAGQQEINTHFVHPSNPEA